MPYYRRVGDVPRKRHTLHQRRRRRLRRGAGGRGGLLRTVGLLYHRRSPSAIVRIERRRRRLRRRSSPNQPVAPHHLRTRSCRPRPGDAVHGAVGAARQRRRRAVVRRPRRRRARCTATRSATSSCTCSRARRARERVRRAAGRGRRLRRRPDGDHPPLGRRRRAGCRAARPRARGHVHVPRQVPHADRPVPRGRAVLRARPARPRPSRCSSTGDDVAGARAHPCRVHRARPRDHPFDVVGWDGCVYPWALNIPTSSRSSAASTSRRRCTRRSPAPGFVVCSFVPRLFDFDPDAVKVPYHHANVDTDEVLFYSAGNFMSRAGSGIGVGSISLHPAGFVHGPQPGSLERSESQTRTEEMAVMIDTFAPLGLSRGGARRQRPRLPLVVGELGEGEGRSPSPSDPLRRGAPRRQQSCPSSAPKSLTFVSVGHGRSDAHDPTAP